MTETVAAERVPTPTGPNSPTPPVPGAGFTLTLTNFEGPFDLLLTLISRRKLDITDIALAEVTCMPSTSMAPPRRWMRRVTLW